MTLELPLAASRSMYSPMARPSGLPGPRRARAACTFCRSRKIRCNAQNGQSCHNCTLENVQCILTPKVRRQKRPTPSTFKDFTPLCRQQRQASFQQLKDADYQPHSTTASRGDLNSPGSCDGLLSQEDDDDGIDWRAAAFETVPLPISPDPTISGSCNRTCLVPDPSRSSVASEIPSFIKPIPSYLTREDVDYLHRKGALCVPEVKLRDALIESYVHYIHPCYPILELGVLKDSIQGKSDHRISLPLFQAIMFAGAAWVDVKMLRRLGFLTRKAARKAFYLKVKVSRSMHRCRLE